MATVRTAFNSFSTGEVSYRFSARHDVGRFYNSCKILENFLILPTGGVTKRPGFRYIKNANQPLTSFSRLIPFRAGATKNYLVELSNTQIVVHDVEPPYSQLFSATTLWLSKDLYDVQYAQYGDHLYLVHPDYPPYKLERTASGWVFQEVAFIWGPFESLNTDPSRKLQSSVGTKGSTGTLTATGFAPFTIDHVGSVWRLKSGTTDGYVRVTSYVSSTQVNIEVVEPVVTSATSEWAEGAFSKDRGYPRMVSSVQSRLVFGGTYKSPNAVWMSVIADPENFVPGANADDSILLYLSALEDPVVQWGVPIKNGLMVGTTSGTFSIAGASGGALSPTSFVAARSTSARSAHVMAQNIDFEVAAVSLQGSRIYMNSYSLEFDSQVVKDMTFLADHLLEFDAPVELSWSQDPFTVVWAPRQDGQLLACSYYALEKILGWSRVVVDGAIESVAVLPTSRGEEVWAVIRRPVNNGGSRYIERMALYEEVYLDSYVMPVYVMSSDTEITGLTHLAGETVVVVDDTGAVYPEQTVSNAGTISNPFQGKTVPAQIFVGKKYSAALVLRDLGGTQFDSFIGRPAKWGQCFIRVNRSVLPTVNGHDMQFRSQADPLGAPTELRTGDYQIDALTGFDYNQDIRIESDTPLRFEIVAFSGQVTVG